MRRELRSSRPVGFVSTACAHECSDVAAAPAETRVEVDADLKAGHRGLTDADSLARRSGGMTGVSYEPHETTPAGWAACPFTDGTNGSATR